MFVVRQRHLEALAEASLDGFEDRMVVHLRARFPRECEEIGEEEVRCRIQDGIERAGRYEIRSERDVARFIRFKFGIGPDFDTSRKTRWAAAILKESDVRPADRLDRVERAAREHRVRRGT
ncbi:MAG: hypothetical protein GY778_05335 [bacterium]|nr:hypothetical protein [bacterium]